MSKKGRGSKNRKTNSEKKSSNSSNKKPTTHEALSYMNEIYLSVIQSGHYNSQDLLSNILIKTVLEQGSEIIAKQLDVLNNKIQLDTGEEIEKNKEDYQKLQKSFIAAITFIEELILDTETNIQELGIDSDSAYDVKNKEDEEEKPKLILPDQIK